MTVTGVLGGHWRATVTEWGAIDPWDGSPRLDWCVAADDRWHRPEHEAAIRQIRIDGTPVVETRLRIPDGDAVQRVWSVADEGGHTLVEVENRSPLPIAVAFTRPDVRTARPPADVPVQGIELPEGTILLPVGHHSSVTVALAHDGSGAGPLPAGLPGALAVARGWLATAHRVNRFVLPDTLLVDAVVAALCDVALAGPTDPDVDPAAFLVGVGVLVRMGESPDPWLPDVAAAVESVARSGLAQPSCGWALDAAAVVLAAAGERRALDDLARVRRGLPAVPSQAVPSTSTTPFPVDAAPLDGVLADGVLAVASLEHAVAGLDGVLFPAGFPPSWLGANIESYGIPAGPVARLSLAVRWHGARPAVLWEVTGGPVTLSAPVVAPGWSVDTASGEALWPAPHDGDDAALAGLGDVAGPTDVTDVTDVAEPGSFS